MLRKEKRWERDDWWSLTNYLSDCSSWWKKVLYRTFIGSSVVGEMFVVSRFIWEPCGGFCVAHWTHTGSRKHSEPIKNHLERLKLYQKLFFFALVPIWSTEWFDRFKVVKQKLFAVSAVIDLIFYDFANSKASPSFPSLEMNSITTECFRFRYSCIIGSDGALNNDIMPASVR